MVTNSNVSVMFKPLETAIRSKGRIRDKDCPTNIVDVTARNPQLFRTFMPHAKRAH